MEYHPDIPQFQDIPPLQDVPQLEVSRVSLCVAIDAFHLFVSKFCRGACVCMPLAGRQHADGPPSVRMHRLPAGAARPRRGPPLCPLRAEWPRAGPSGPRIRPPPRRVADFASGELAAPALSLVAAKPWASSRRLASFFPERLPFRQHRRLRVARSR